jgi:hypothetical protein
LALGEIVVGLRTTSHAQALSRARVLRVRVKKLMSELDLVATKTEAERKIRAWIDASIAGFETDLAARGTTYFDGAEIAQMGAEAAASGDMLLRGCARFHFQDDLRPQIRRVLGGLLPLADTQLAATVADIAAEAGLALEVAGASRALVERIVLRGLATLLDERLAHEGGAIAPVAKLPAMPPPPTREPTSEPSFFCHWYESSPRSSL